MYRGLTTGIPDIYAHEITCDLETMKALIKAYGRDVEQYREIFEKYVSANIDTITRVLWQKQPLSLTIVQYYKALVDKTNLAQCDECGKVFHSLDEYVEHYKHFHPQSIDATVDYIKSYSCGTKMLTGL